MSEQATFMLLLLILSWAAAFYSGYFLRKMGENLKRIEKFRR